MFCSVEKEMKSKEFIGGNKRPLLMGMHYLNDALCRMNEEKDHSDRLSTEKKINVICYDDGLIVGSRRS